MKISDLELQKLIMVMESKDLSFSDAIELIEKSNTQVNKIKLTVDYTKTIDQVIADGNYTLKLRDISAKDFTIPSEMIGKKVELSAKLFHFNRKIKAEDAISEMNKVGYRPATSMEFLTLGSLYPELQTEFQILSLDPFMYGEPNLGGRGLCVLCLNADGFSRQLTISWFNYRWYASCRFLGVRK